MWQSNALWPDGVVSSQWGDNISTDKHDTIEQAAAVCRLLKLEGLGAEKKIFPRCVWSSGIEQPPILPKYWEWVEPSGYYDSAEARRK